MNDVPDRDEVLDNDKNDRSPRWDISQERAFVENLLGQRFNFLLLFFSIFVAGAVNAREAPVLQATVLSLGAIIALFLALAIWRTQRKLDLILARLGKTHPASFTDRHLRSGRHFIGFYIPPACCAALTLGALYGWIALIYQCHLSVSWLH